MFSWRLLSFCMFLIQSLCFCCWKGCFCSCCCQRWTHLCSYSSFQAILPQQNSIGWWWTELSQCQSTTTSCWAYLFYSNREEEEATTGQNLVHLLVRPEPQLRMRLLLLSFYFACIILLSVGNWNWRKEEGKREGGREKQGETCR